MSDGAGEVFVGKGSEFRDSLSPVFDDPEQYFQKECWLRNGHVPFNERELIREQVSLFTRVSPHAQIVIN